MKALGNREKLAQVGSTCNGESARVRIGALSYGSSRMDAGKLWADVAMIMVSHRTTSMDEISQLTEHVIGDIVDSLSLQVLRSIRKKKHVLRNEIHDQLHRAATGAMNLMSIRDRAKAARMRESVYRQLSRSVASIIDNRLDEVSATMDLRD